MNKHSIKNSLLLEAQNIIDKSVMDIEDYPTLNDVISIYENLIQELQIISEIIDDIEASDDYNDEE